MSTTEKMLDTEIGDCLREARRAMGLSPREAAARLKCGEDVILVLETGRGGGLAPVYLKGFLAAYVDLLDIPHALAGRIRDSWAAAEPELRSVFPEIKSNQPADRWLRAASYVLATLLVGTLAWQVTHEVARLSEGQRNAMTNPDGSATVPTGAAAGTHVNASIAALETLPEYSLERGSGAGGAAWAALERQAGGEMPELLEGEYFIELSASADSWVEIRDRQGKFLEQDLVRGGSNREYRGLAPFRITLGRTSAIQMLVNGVPVELAATEGDDVTQMLFDPASLESAPDNQQGQH